MDNFIDTCVILSKFDMKDKFHHNCEEFLDNNSNHIISFYQDKTEIPFLFYRKEKVISEALKFSLIPSHQIDYNDLSPKERILLKKMIADIKLFNLPQSELFLRKKAMIFFKQQILSFIQKKITRKVIPEDIIDNALVQILFNKINNQADSKIISSAIQEHQNNKLQLITNDSSDWKKEVIVESTKGTKYIDIPNIKYLLS